MTTFTPEDSNSQVENPPWQHSFILLGEQQLFGVHMTQYHTEVHKYQCIFKLELPPQVHRKFLQLRREYPKDTLVLCNSKNIDNPAPGEVREFILPELGAGMVKKFKGSIFVGLAPFPPEDMQTDPHFFPWSPKYARPAIEEFEATVERVVTFRPFDHQRTLSTYASYLLFGDSKSGETHMTNLQSANLISNLLEPPVYGPDYDHILSLQERPAWLQQDAMLEAGIVVMTPDVRLLNPDDGKPQIPAAAPFAKGEQIEVMYRGIRPVRSVTAGQSYLYCTAVCNSPGIFSHDNASSKRLKELPQIPAVCEFSGMPEKYWATKAG